MTPLEALQRTLAAEHASIFVYGALGAQTSASRTPRLFDEIARGYRLHRARRDELTRAILDLGDEPVVSAATYELPNALASTADVTAAGLQVERSCAGTYSSLVASSAGERRIWAVAALTDAAVRELVFGGTPEMFPGIDEFTDH